MEARIRELDTQIKEMQRPKSAPAPKSVKISQKPAPAAKKGSRISVGGKKAIADAQKKRWAKVRRERKAAGTVPSRARRARAASASQNDFDAAEGSID